MNKMYQALLRSLRSLMSPYITINSNYDVWQRGTGALTMPTTYSKTTSFSADRLFTVPAGATLTTQQVSVTPDNNSCYSLQLNGAASVTTVDHGQRISSAYKSRYRQELVFSAYVYNASGAAFTPTLRVDTPGAVDDWTTPTNRLSQSLQECPDVTWTQVSHIFNPSGYTNINNGMSIYLRIPSGSLVAGDTVRISQFRLVERVYGVLPFFAPDAHNELMRCLPYTRIVGPNSNGTYNTATRILVSEVFDPPMRAAPVALLTNTAFQILEIGVGFQTGASSTIVGSSLQARGVYLDIDGFTGLTVDKEIRIVSADVALLSAEL